MRRPIYLIALLFVGVLAAMADKSLLVAVPDVRAPSPAGQFDAIRAKERLARILGDQQPHPADTPASDGVRERLVTELRALGLRPIVRDQLACNEIMKARGVSCARVRNIIALLGPPTGKAILINSHYDSSVAGPGAADAGVGVAAMLEVAAQLRQERLQRPVILLFNEGEELGLVGARAFLRDPLSRNVDGLINLEARGVRGPANMFETSVPNGPAIAWFSRAVQRPVANSLSTDVYRLMPNYTDVNSFEERGWTTLNLAIIGNETRYHSPGDNLAALAPASLQHMGDQALALARELQAGAPTASGQTMFMDLLGRELLTLPSWIGLTLLELLFLACAWLTWRRKALGRGLLVAGGSLLAATALAWALQALVGFARPGMFWRAYPIWTHLAVYATALLAGAALLAGPGRRLDERQLRAACWLTFLLVGTLLAIWAPGGAIYFLLPPIAFIAGVLGGRLWRGAERAGALFAILSLYLTYGAMLALLEELLNQGPMWAFAPLGLLLILPMLIEARSLIAERPRIALASAAALVLAGWTAAGVAPAYSMDRKQRFAIEYVRDGQRSWWAIANDGAPPSGFGAGWERRELPHISGKRWAIAAPAVPGIEPAGAEVVASTIANGERQVRLRLRTNGAQTVALVAPEDAQIGAAGANGFIRPMRVNGGSGKYVIRCTGRSCDGLPLDLIIRGRKPVALTIVGLRPGLPTGGIAMQRRRPAEAQPQYIPDQTVTVARLRV